LKPASASSGSAPPSAGERPHGAAAAADALLRAPAARQCEALPNGNPPPQLAALAGVTAQEDERSESRKTRPRKPDAIEAKQAFDQQFVRWVMLHVQSNPLPICTRPRVLIKAKRT
jgi:hypothetical protein